MGPNFGGQLTPQGSPMGHGPRPSVPPPFVPPPTGPPPPGVTDAHGNVTYPRDPSQDQERPTQRDMDSIIPYYQDTGGGIRYPTTPQEFYWQYRNMLRNMRNQYPEGTHWGWLQARMNPALLSPAGGFGMAHLAEILRDPYNLPDDRLRDMMQNTEVGYNKAGQAIKEAGLQSGAGFGGVAGKAGQQVELAKGAEQARNMREYEQWRQETGDRRLNALLLPYLQTVNQAAGVAEGVPAQSGPSSTDQWLQYAMMLASILT